jgi:hypothetical protein
VLDREKSYRYFIDPSFTRTGVFLISDDQSEYHIFSVTALPVETVVKNVKVKGVYKEKSVKQNCKIVNYPDAYYYAALYYNSMSDLLFKYPPYEINTEIPGIRGFKIERFLWGLSFKLMDLYGGWDVPINYIEPNIIGNSQKKFLKEKEYPDVKLSRKEANKLGRRGRADVVRNYFTDVLCRVNQDELNDDTATAILFYVFQKEYDLVYKPVLKGGM